MSKISKKAVQADVESRILTIRSQKVILDCDLATLYGVETKNLNKAISRNKVRFPEDFAFRLTRQEVTSLRFQNGTSNEGRGGTRYPPYAFTEHGTIMAANVLRSPKAVEMSVFIVRAFVKMREQLMATATLAKRLAEVEKVLLTHDSGVRDLYEKIRPLLLPPDDPPKKRIGFGVKESRAKYRTRKKSKTPALPGAAIRSDSEIMTTAKDQLAEKECRRMLDMAKNYIANQMSGKARVYLQEIIEKYPDTSFAQKAKKELENLE